MIPSLISYSDSDCHTVIIFLLSQLPYVQEESDYRFPFSHHHLSAPNYLDVYNNKGLNSSFSLCHMLTCNTCGSLYEQVNLRMKRIES